VDNRSINLLHGFALVCVRSKHRAETQTGIANITRLIYSVHDSLCLILKIFVIDFIGYEYNEHT
jgi:hypothetical protein